MISRITMPSPLGLLLLTAEYCALTGIDFLNSAPPAENSQESAEPTPVLDEAARQIASYFQGTLQRFTLNIAPRGTAFQRHVWAVLPDIPYGMTISYGEVARRIGKPKAARAAGQAVGRNPLPIVLPCHRVIGSDGSMTGFSGGLCLKEFLLKLEARPREAGRPATGF
ncbi:MAG TPA: methylated-DNA--[protein]-cysteine S-methyltransferase [Acidobacteriota bacterium]|nr:methylated-DNA--[protein]-cysteine S-methyltransferase [Acidobacteriota bacterium]